MQATGVTVACGRAWAPRTLWLIAIGGCTERWMFMDSMPRDDEPEI
jgi:hypothetical protein